MLKSIEPKFEDKIEPSLMYVITRAFEDYCDDASAIPAMDIKHFLNSYMRSFFTFDIQYLERYIIANAKEWDNVKLDRSINRWRIYQDG